MPYFDLKQIRFAKEVQRKFKGSDFFGIINRQLYKCSIRKLKSKSPVRGITIPYKATIFELAVAVALRGKPVAEQCYMFYEAEKDMIDYIMNHYGLEIMADFEFDSFWMFKPENRSDAIRRMTAINDILRLKRFSLDDHRKMGRLYGYSESNINKFIACRKSEDLKMVRENLKRLKQLNSNSS